MWFDSGMRVRKADCFKRTIEHMNEQIYDAGKNNSPTSGTTNIFTGRWTLAYN